MTLVLSRVYLEFCVAYQETHEIESVQDKGRERPSIIIIKAINVKKTKAHAAPSIVLHISLLFLRLVNDSIKQQQQQDARPEW